MITWLSEEPTNQTFCWIWNEITFSQKSWQVCILCMHPRYFTPMLLLFLSFPSLFQAILSIQLPATPLPLKWAYKEDWSRTPLKNFYFFSPFPSLILWLQAGSDAFPPCWAGSRSVSNGTTEGWFPMAMTLVLDPLMPKKVRNPVKAFPLFNAFITSPSHEDLLVSNNTVDLIPQLFPKQAHE